MIESTIYHPADTVMDDLSTLKVGLRQHGCKACDLGLQEGLNGCCVARGNERFRRMIIGEAPGRHEDATTLPFVGPAGELMDRIFASVGFDTNTDFYITNTILCRPIAPKGSGKENFTPRIEQKRRCRPFLDAQIRLVNPRIIVTLGIPATEAVLGLRNIKMGDYRGVIKTINQGFYALLGTRPIYVFPMLHPAAILHAKSQPEKYKLYRQQTWTDIQFLKKFIEENVL